MIDPSAVIDPAAELDEGVAVGPYSVIGPGVRIGSGTRIGPHVVIKGPTTIGRDNRIFQFASIGDDPQDMKYAGEETSLEIGDRNVIREFATLNRGTAQDAVTTRVGDDNLFMAYIHVAHDCLIGNHVIMANGASLGGHVKIDDWAILGGFTMVHQFCRIGAHSFCAMGTGVSKDVPPYVLVGGHPARPHGINVEGLRRRGFSADSLQRIKQGYRILYKQNNKLSQAREQLRELAGSSPDVALYVDFLDQSERSIVR
ncbi:MAG TPA: acyl-ACP--UDP-N-acetylglucosamine O-acyltransferase [Sedimenticola thiotaurini]|uniref:Acyl-[acyl-carrier-protein]--UDP-N-acetylglucosamine O-acyltransferase n=1 Tax=Sedimenticola thiotaurini TaxID=1543721 RepID=A0A831RPC4_9GAMM|nr:acyl-ACP--UDP-N-acetylglucosamine O-acyltransferase [Sedimenticola thiotaurini]